MKEQEREQVGLNNTIKSNSNDIKCYYVAMEETAQSLEL